MMGSGYRPASGAVGGAASRLTPVLVAISNTPRDYAWAARRSSPTSRAASPVVPRRPRSGSATTRDRPPSCTTAPTAHSTRGCPRWPRMPSCDEAALPSQAPPAAGRRRCRSRCTPRRSRPSRASRERRPAGVPRDAGSRNYKDDNHKPRGHRRAERDLHRARRAARDLADPSPRRRPGRVPGRGHAPRPPLGRRRVRRVARHRGLAPRRGRRVGDRPDRGCRGHPPTTPASRPSGS